MAVKIKADEALARRLLPGIARGLSNRDLARLLHLSEETVRVYLTATYRWLGATNRAHAVAIAFSRGLLVVRDGQVCVPEPRAAA